MHYSRVAYHPLVARISQHALRRGVSAPRGVSATGGFCSGWCLPGVCVSQHALRHTPPPPHEQNDRQV